MPQKRCFPRVFGCVFFDHQNAYIFWGVKILSRVWTQLRCFGTVHWGPLSKKESVPGFWWLCVASLKPPWHQRKPATKTPGDMSFFTETKNSPLKWIRFKTFMTRWYSVLMMVAYLFWLCLILKPEFLRALERGSPLGFTITIWGNSQQAVLRLRWNWPSHMFVL